MTEYDVTIVGAGPSGSAAAIVCAQNGLRTLLLEKSQFPREKICGDCLNPSCWPVFDRFGVSAKVLALPHSKLGALEFVPVTGRHIRFGLNTTGSAEIALKRSHLDQLLLNHARECGAHAHEKTAVTGLKQTENGWQIRTAQKLFTTRFLIGADGRNSAVSRLAGIAPKIHRNRIALQTHFPAPANFEQRVVMRLLRHGYCGLASVGDNQLNLCLVSRPGKIRILKAWAESHFGLPESQSWRSITPLARQPAPLMHNNLLLVGDAARVVEPFTGEGIYYALASGETAARCIVNGTPGNYPSAHRQLYQGRLWVNQLAKLAVLHPRTTSFIMNALGPSSLRPFCRSILGSVLNDRAFETDG